MRKKILNLKAKRVLLQMPEGLKPEAPRIAEIVEKEGALAIISGDPCYGACDLATSEAESIGADLIIHFAHSRLLKNEKVPTLYLDVKAKTKIDEAVISSLPLLEGYNKIGLVTTLQHIQELEAAEVILANLGKTIEVGNTNSSFYPGQILGCDFSNAKSISSKIEAFLFIGGGRFHAIGVALATSKPTLVADPYAGNAYSVQEEVQRILKQRYASIKEASRAKKIGVLISLKPGQKNLESAFRAKKDIEKMGKNAYLFALREILPSILLEFPTIDAYVNTACPRISIDDASKFKKPVLTLQEFMVVAGELTWDSLLKEGLFEN